MLEKIDFIRDIDELLMSSSSEDEFIEELMAQQMMSQHRSNRRTCRTHKRACVNGYAVVDCRKYFRLKKEAFWRLHSMIRQESDGGERRSRELSAEHKLLSVLRLFACGNMEQTAADYVGISQPTISSILPKVCDAILRHLHADIRMPRTAQERLAKGTAFAELAESVDFPRCFKAIDCTHIRMILPGAAISEAFRHRHGYFSLN